VLEVLRGISEAPLIRYVQRPMNIGPLMKEVYDVEQRGLGGHAVRMHRFG
jgi:hypothetical protein